MKLTKPVESMSISEVLAIFHKDNEPKFPLFYDRLVKLSDELFGDNNG